MDFVKCLQMSQTFDIVQKKAAGLKKIRQHLSKKGGRLIFFKCPSYHLFPGDPLTI
jgi:hypothetical protein